MSDSSDRNGEIIEDAEENKEFIFFMYKERKERRFKNLAEEYEKIFNVPIMSKHLSKKICNMKGEIKTKLTLTQPKTNCTETVGKIAFGYLISGKNPVFTKSAHFVLF
jgi:hypothetical protein